MRRLVSEMITPDMATFADALVAPGDRLGLAEVTVASDAPLSGRTLAEAQAGFERDCVVIGLRGAHTDNFVYQPDEGAVLDPGATLIILGDDKQIARFGRLIGGG